MPSARRILERSAKQLAKNYESPPKHSRHEGEPDADDLIVTEGIGMSVYVSDSSRVHQGDWVRIDYDYKRRRKRMIEILYKTGGAAGNVNDSELLRLEEANPDKIRKIVHEYLD